MTIQELCEQAHAASRAKGWYDTDGGKRNIGELISLVHSELSEALEDWRNGDMETAYEATGSGAQKPVGFASEMADVVIRVGDLCAYLGIDLERAIEEKMAFNTTRPYRHGNKRA